MNQVVTFSEEKQLILICGLQKRSTPPDCFRKFGAYPGEIASCVTWSGRKCEVWNPRTWTCRNPSGGQHALPSAQRWRRKRGTNNSWKKNNLGQVYPRFSSVKLSALRWIELQQLSTYLRPRLFNESSSYWKYTKINVFYYHWKQWRKFVCSLCTDAYSLWRVYITDKSCTESSGNLCLHLSV